MKKSPYIAFTSPIYRILNLIGAILFMIVGFLSNVYIGSFGAVLIAGTVPVIIVFLDYFAFAGTSTRKQKTMNFMKSSFKGIELFKSAVKTDIYLKEICLLFGFLGYLLAEIINSSEPQFLFDAFLLVLVYLPLSEITTRVTLIIARRMAVSILTQMAVCYLCSMLMTMLMFLYSFLMPEQLGDYYFTLIIISITMEAISILCAVLLYKDCIKGYESSFIDS